MGMLHHVARVSIIRCRPEQFKTFCNMLDAAERALVPGSKAMCGLLAYFAGADEATSSLTNVSVWETLEAAKQMDRFQPMLDLAKHYHEKGATFERPIMNYAVLWQVGGASR